MKKILIFTWCINLSIENLLSSETTGKFSFSAQPLTDFKSKWPHFHSKFQRLHISKPEKSADLKNNYREHNTFKNEYGYALSGEYSIKQNQQNSVNIIPDTSIVYHSLTNPLFKSKSLNLEPHGDIHKISNPFESKWIVLPPSQETVKHVTPNPSSVFKHKERNSLEDSHLSPSDFKFKLLSNSKLSNSSLLTNAFHIHKNNSSKIIPNYSKLETFDDLSPKIISTTTKSTPNSQKSFIGYNFKEVKTSDGKTRRIMQVFDNDGLRENIEYNEQGVLNKSENANVTLPEPIKISELNDTVLKNAIQKAVTYLHQRNSTTGSAGNVVADNRSRHPKSVVITTKTESEDSAGSLLSNPISNFKYVNQPRFYEFAAPELILFDFLEQLQSFPYDISQKEHFESNDFGTFDESIRENTFFYRQK